MGGREEWETEHRSDKAERKGERVVGSSSLCSTFLGAELAAFLVSPSLCTYIILDPKSQMHSQGPPDR